MNVRLIAVLALFFVPLFSHATVLGNIGYDTTFVADGSFAAIQNLGNGTFSNGERVTGVDIRIAAPLGNIFRPEIRSFLANSNMSTMVEATYQPTAGGENVFHFELPTPFVPDPSECYVLWFYQFASAPNTTFYGWSNNQYTASTTGCHPQYTSHNINTALQNPALNGHGMVDYSFQIHTEPIVVPQSPPVVSNLKQYRQFGVDEISEGDTFIGNAAVFKANISDADSAQVKLEIELKPIDVPFDGAGSFLSPLAAPGAHAAENNELIPKDNHYVTGGNVESFHWRARAVDAEGNTSEWVEHPSVSNSDFTAKVVPLWTQVDTNFPNRPDEEEWAGELYASGVDKDCAPREPGFRATIAKCGCALTSAIMVARYNGLDKNIEGTDINPRTANAWLQDESHKGYTQDNRVKWPQLERYLGVRIDGRDYARLELDRDNFKTDDVGVVNSYLTQQVPIIAFNKKYGHFIVLESQITNPSPTYAIRDPLWYNTKTLIETKNIAQNVQSYQNQFASSTIFTKLESPRPIVASVELFLASPAEILVTDPTGRRSGRDANGITYNEILDAHYYLDDPISSSEEEINESQIHRVKAMILPALVDGTYDVQVIGTGSGSYTLTSSMTGTSGSTTFEIFTASTSPNTITQYDLIVSGGEPQDTSPTPPPPPTVPELFASLKNTIQASNAKVLVKTALLVQVAAAEKLYQKGKNTDAKKILSAVEAEVKLLKKKSQISVAHADTILAALAALKARL